MLDELSPRPLTSRNNNLKVLSISYSVITKVPAPLHKLDLVSNSHVSPAPSLIMRPLEFLTTGATAVLGQPIIHLGAPRRNSKSL